MEAEPGRQRSRQKHRERALQQQEKQTREGEGTIGQDDRNESPPRSSRDKLPRSKPKKGKCALFEEDIIDGFAILSFKTLEDLEILAKKNACNKDRSKSEEDNIKDTHSQDKDDNDKTKKKKLKKNSSHNHCTENCGGVISDSNSSNIAPADSARSSSEIGGCGSSGSSNHISEDHNSDNQSYNVHHHHHHHHLHHHNLHHSTVPLEPPRSISRDRLSDASTHSGSGQGYVCDVESGDDKASESGSELYSGIPVGGILNHITSSNLLPAEALSAPTPPPSTSATPISLCNGIGGPASESPTAALHHVLVVTTTTTTTTTTRSTSKSGFSDSVTTSTSTAVSVAAVQPPPSVIHPSPYLPGHQDSKLSQLSPGSFLSQSQSKRSLSPSSQEQVVNNNHSNFISASSSCARSLQYSKSHKSNHIPNNTKDLPSCYSPNVFGRSDSPQNHPHLIQPPAFNSLPPSRVQNGSHNLSHLSPDLLQPRPGNSFLLNSHSPGAGYPYPPVIRPEPLVNHHSSRSVGETKFDHQLSSSLVSNNGVHATATATSPITANTGNHHSQQHHRSSSSSLGKSNTHHHHHSHQQHGFGGGSRSRSPPGHSSKRPCKSPSGLLLSSSSAATSSLSSATVPPLSDPYKRFSTPLPSKQQQQLSGKSDNAKHSTTGSEKDYPEVKSKDSSVSSAGHQHGHHHHHHHSKEHRDKDKERERDKQRTPVSLSTSLPSTIFQSPNPAWSSTSGPILNPLLPLHQPSPLSSSSTLHPLVPHPSQSSVASLFPLPLPSAPPLLAAGAPSLSAGMFAAPIHPAPPSLSSAPPLPAHPAASSQFSAESLLRSQDFLHQDLNNRLLAAHRDSSTIALPPSPFVRSETHQHQHQHLHNHMHQHTYGGLNAAPLVPPTPPLFDKLPKAFEAGIFRPSIVHSYNAAFSSLLPPGPSGASLASSLQGAFQPKSLVTPGQMLVSFREREKAVLPPVVPPLQKKQGKWCAVHVRVAWEIYHRQQKKLQRDHDGAPGSTSTSSSKSGPDTKPLEPLLRPPSHLLPGSAATARPPESPLLASVARSLPDGIAHPGSSFLSSAAHLGISSFPRPSPYPVPSLLNPLGFSGLGTSMFTPVHDKVPAGLPSGMSSSPHEWSRLHRTPSTFPSWPKLEVEKERERELRREEEKDRERRGSLSHPHAGMDEIRHKDVDYSRPKSRSRSRSPLRNGRLDHHSKSEVAPYDRRFEDKRSMSTAASLHKLKDERRDDDVPALSLHLVDREKLERERLERERLDKDRFERDRMERDRLERERIEKDKLLQSAAVAEREKLLQAVEREKLFQTSGYLGLNPFGSALPTHPGLLDRRVGLMGSPGAPYPFLERAPVPTSMWSPFDKSAAEFAHRLEMERERERMAMMSRLSSVPSHLAVLEQERLKEQILREQQEREYELRRQYFDRLPAFSADRLRAADPLALGSYFPQTISPMFAQGGLAGLKSNSPHGMSGAPPPLIPSAGSAVAGTVLPSRSHDNSPSSSSKLKGCSPADSTSDLKDKREDSSTDPDAHSR